MRFHFLIAFVKGGFTFEPFYNFFYDFIFILFIHIIKVINLFINKIIIYRHLKKLFLLIQRQSAKLTSTCNNYYVITLKKFAKNNNDNNNSKVKAYLHCCCNLQVTSTVFGKFPTYTSIFKCNWNICEAMTPLKLCHPCVSSSVTI